jgi:hypothetical protein
VAAEINNIEKTTKGENMAVKGRKEFDSPQKRTCQCGCQQEYEPTGRAQKYIRGHRKGTAPKPTAVAATKIEVIDIVTHAGSTMERTAKRAMVLDILIAAGVVTEERVVTICEFVKKRNLG